MASLQPALRRRLEAYEISVQARYVAGRDGMPTYTLTTPGGARHWLGSSSMPSVSSEALLSSFQPGRTNILLPSIGHGYEVRLLLEHLRPHQAVFTWDRDLLAPALALRIHDFSTPLSQGRLVPCVDPDVAQALERAFERVPDYLPPEKLFSAPQFSAAEMREMARAAESAAARQHHKLLSRLDAVRSASRPAREASSPRSGRIVVISMVPDTVVHQVARGLAHAAERSGKLCKVLIADHPSRAHLLPYAQFLLQELYDRIILLDQVKNEFGDLLSHTAGCVSWYVSGGDPRSDLAGLLSPDDVLLADSRHQQRRLQALLPARDRVGLIGPVVDEALFRPLTVDDTQRAQYGSQVAIVQNAVSLRPEDMGVHWDSHKLLVETLIDRLSQDPLRLDQSAAEVLLDEIGAQCGVRFDAPDMRRRLLEVIATRIAPTLAVRAIVRALRSDGVDIRVWGTGWDSVEADCEWARLTVPAAGPRNLIYNSSAVVLHVRNDCRDEQHLLEGLAAGAYVLRMEDSPGDALRQRALPDLYQSVPAFKDIEHCRTRVHAWLADEHLRRSESAAVQARVRQECLMHVRLPQLLQAAAR